MLQVIGKGFDLFCIGVCRYQVRLQSPKVPEPSRSHGDELMPLVRGHPMNLGSRDHFARPVSQMEGLGHPQQHFGIPSERDSRQPTLFQMCKKPTSLVWQRFCGMPCERSLRQKQLVKHSRTSPKLEKAIRLCFLIMWRPLRPHSLIHRKENMIDHITGKTTFKVLCGAAHKIFMRHLPLGS
jgi:hypothetical protein